MILLSCHWVSIMVDFLTIPKYEHALTSNFYHLFRFCFKILSFPFLSCQSQSGFAFQNTIWSAFVAPFWGPKGTICKNHRKAQKIPSDSSQLAQAPEHSSQWSAGLRAETNAFLKRKILSVWHMSRLISYYLKKQPNLHYQKYNIIRNSS